MKCYRWWLSQLIFHFSQTFFFNFEVYLFERLVGKEDRDRETHRDMADGSSTHWFRFQVPAAAGLGQAEAWSWMPHLGLFSVTET